MSDSPPSEKTFTVGDRVRIAVLPPYLKTAEVKPMLRPPNLVQQDEEGIVVDLRPGGYWSVRFAKGTFLMDSRYLDSVEDLEAIAPPFEAAPPDSPFIAEDSDSAPETST